MNQSNNSFTTYLTRLVLILTFVFLITSQAQETVTDYDGNVYNTVTIGNQVWLKEDLRSLHYTDGTEIPDVAAYDNSDSLAQIYGRLYTWDAAMGGSTEESTQGIAPDGWHIPSDAEWKELENYLGGASVAGGKMKESGEAHWKLPNTGATNESGFSGLPAGEYDAHYSPHIFQFLNTHAVYWTSTQVSSRKARERYLAFDNAKCSKYDWYKEMKYSIRCVKDITTNIDDKENINHDFSLQQNYPNPFNPTTTINYSLAKPSYVSLKIYDILGKEVRELVNDYKPTGVNSIEWDGKSNTGNSLCSGMYFCTMKAGNFTETKKMMLIK